eukprot:TRINITY_DN335_c0_g4_i1.p1 TRINITY_DN335_c0_g4~~TRINITY_DN335_c0_g4_i1.p1  ORF type:complete len:1380 (-),score=414.43 TRINITY_DN335_c0_g4_i1:928-5067(-)
MKNFISFCHFLFFLFPFLSLSVCVCVRAFFLQTVFIFIMEKEEKEKDKDVGFVDPSTRRPEIKWPFPASLFYPWVTPIMMTGAKRPLEERDLPELSIVDNVPKVSGHFHKVWENEKCRPMPSLWRSLRHAFGKRFYLAGVLKLFYDILNLSQSLTINRIINYIAHSDDKDASEGYMWAGLLFLTLLCGAMMIHRYFYMVTRVGLHIRTGLVGEVYKKAIVLTPAERQKRLSGSIVNHMSIDTVKMEKLMDFLHVTWSGVFQIVGALVLLYFFIGPSVFAGFFVMVVMIPVQWRLGKMISSLRKANLKQSDQRVKLMNEILQGIRVIKFFAWEGPFGDLIRAIRTRELCIIKKAAKVAAVNLSLFVVTPVLVSVATFGTYVALGNELDAPTVFTALSLFNLMRFPLVVLPMVITAVLEARISANRIHDFLVAEELKPLHKVDVCHSESGDVDADAEKEETSKRVESCCENCLLEDEEIAVRKGSFEWDEQTKLENIDVSFKKGKMTVIVGHVGCGKSSLLSALLGEMVQTHGSVLRQRVTYGFVPQQAFIMNGTVKENIIFGKPFDIGRYEMAIRVCSLERDLEVLPAGDETEIGEKGINLSGGQKQRVALARAVYANEEVFLLDDPLSAVDAHVGRHLFEECLIKALANKTRILVTHQLQFVPRCDHIVFMEEMGVTEQGSYAELMAKRGKFFDLMSSFELHDSDSSASSEDVEEEGLVGESKGKGKAVEKEKALKQQEDADGIKGKGELQKSGKADGKMQIKEERQTGKVSSHVIIGYLVAAGGGLVVSIVIGLLVLAQLIRVATDVWLALWSSDSIRPRPSIGTYIGVYAGLAILRAIVELIRALWVATVGVRAGKTLHIGALRGLLRSPVWFFDVTPTGRIINRFSKDIESIDGMLPQALQSFLNTFSTVCSSLIVICVIIPFFIIPLIPILFIYYTVQKYYRFSSRELKRLDSITRSPVYNHFSESLVGASTIRGFGRVDDFCEKNRENMSRNFRAYRLWTVSLRWLGVRLEVLAAFIVGFTAFFLVFQADSVNDGMAGLALIYATTLTGMLNWVVRQAAEAEAQFNAVERILFYKDELEEEFPEEVEDARPPIDWPSKGEMEFESLSMKYRTGADIVLRNINLHVQPHEKIGVVGRTGSGKSSLMNALFRIVEPMENTKIRIDGVDILKMGLKDLRSNLSIIPQDPWLFSGTVRQNLDPFEAQSDESIWSALEKVHMKHVVADLKEGLNAKVSENADNFSVGQRQLLCLCRAILKRSRILVMDEATANVDMATDRLIQKTVREEFENCTVLTIAHRLNTIIDMDRVIVLDQGNIVEFDTPATLVDMENGVFRSMVDETGPASSKRLIQVAKGIIAPAYLRSSASLQDVAIETEE